MTEENKEIDTARKNISTRIEAISFVDFKILWKRKEAEYDEGKISNDEMKLSINSFSEFINITDKHGGFSPILKNIDKFRVTSKALSEYDLMLSASLSMYLVTLTNPSKETKNYIYYDTLQSLKKISDENLLVDHGEYTMILYDLVSAIALRRKGEPIVGHIHTGAIELLEVISKEGLVLRSGFNAISGIKISKDDSAFFRDQAKFFNNFSAKNNLAPDNIIRRAGISFSKLGM